MYVPTLTIVTSTAVMMFSGANSVSQERERIAANRMHKRRRHREERLEGQRDAGAHAGNQDRP